MAQVCEWGVPWGNSADATRLDSHPPFGLLRLAKTLFRDGHSESNRD